MRPLGLFYWAVLDKARDTVDLLAVEWLVRRRTLDRRYAEVVIEALAERIGARVEYTKAP